MTFLLIGPYICPILVLETLGAGQQSRNSPSLIKGTSAKEESCHPVRGILGGFK
jgi:hypothetical protein